MINSIPVINKQDMIICNTKDILNGNSFREDIKTKQSQPTKNIDI